MHLHQNRVNIYIETQNRNLNKIWDNFHNILKRYYFAYLITREGHYQNKRNEIVTIQNYKQKSRPHYHTIQEM